MPIFRQYATTSGQKSTIVLPMVDSGGNYVSGLSFAAGDVKIMKDGGSWANVSNSVASESEGWYSLALTEAEMSAAIIVVKFVDQSSPKAWLDTSVIIETGGNASAIWSG